LVLLLLKKRAKYHEKKLEKQREIIEVELMGLNNISI
jgi:hypothetical protein